MRRVDNIRHFGQDSKGEEVKNAEWGRIGTTDFSLSPYRIGGTVLPSPLLLLEALLEGGLQSALLVEERWRLRAD